MRFPITVVVSLLWSTLSMLNGVDGFTPSIITNTPSTYTKHDYSALSYVSIRRTSLLRAVESEEEEDEIVPIDSDTDEVVGNVTVMDNIVTIVDDTLNTTSDAKVEEPADVPVQEPAYDETETDSVLSSEEITENLLFLQSLAAITSRGESATKAQRNAVKTVVSKLEASNPNPEPTITTDLIEGTWELVLAENGHLFRSSPFFMAGRAVCTTPDQAQQFDWFCSMHRKALAISNIASVR